MPNKGKKLPPSKGKCLRCGQTTDEKCKVIIDYEKEEVDYDWCCKDCQDYIQNKMF